MYCIHFTTCKRPPINNVYTVSVLTAVGPFLCMIASRPPSLHLEPASAPRARTPRSPFTFRQTQRLCAQYQGLLLLFLRWPFAGPVLLVLRWPFVGLSLLRRVHLSTHCVACCLPLIVAVTPFRIGSAFLFAPFLHHFFFFSGL